MKRPPDRRVPAEPDEDLVRVQVEPAAQAAGATPPPDLGGPAGRAGLMRLAAAGHLSPVVLGPVGRAEEPERSLDEGLGGLRDHRDVPVGSAEELCDRALRAIGRDGGHDDDTAARLLQDTGHDELADTAALLLAELVAVTARHAWRDRPRPGRPPLPHAARRGSPTRSAGCPPRAPRSPGRPSPAGPAARAGARRPLRRRPVADGQARGSS